LNTIKLNKMKKKMSDQRFAEYQSEIVKLQKKDKLITQRIEDQFKELDNLAYAKGKKDLLKEWERVQDSWYSYLDRDELEKEYNDWFFNLYVDENSICKSMTNDKMIKELINDELGDRKDDSNEELKETIENIKSLSVI